MKLNDILLTEDKHSQLTKLAHYMVGWLVNSRNGQHHGDDDTLPMTPVVFLNVKRYIPEALYTGPGYRVMSIPNPHKVQNVSQAIRQHKHSAGDQVLSWAYDMEGVHNFLDGGGKPGRLFVTVEQHIVDGVDIAKTWDWLCSEGYIEEMHQYNLTETAHHQHEVVAPLMPSMHVTGYYVADKQYQLQQFKSWSDAVAAADK